MGRASLPETPPVPLALSRPEAPPAPLLPSAPPLPPLEEGTSETAVVPRSANFASTARRSGLPISRVPLSTTPPLSSAPLPLSSVVPASGVDRGWLGS